jgi:polysaccharide biosynthesis PFTS motif protein
MILPETFTAHIYKRIDGVIYRIEDWIPDHATGALGYEKSSVCKRLAQVIAMRLTDPFLEECTKRYLKDSTSGMPETRILNYGGLTIDTHDGAVRPKAGMLLYCSVLFTAVWLVTLCVWIVTLFKAGLHYTSSVMIIGVPDSDLRRNRNDKRFIDFCKHGPLHIVRQAKHLVVQATRPVNATEPDTVTYTKQPLLSLMLSQRYSFNESLFFLNQHSRAFGNYIYYLCKLPVACLLWRDFACHASAAVLNRKKAIEAVVITNSNWLQQFLWMTDLRGRNFLTYMALYSLNSSLLVFKADPINSTHPGFRHLRTDKIWIWNESYKEVLEKGNVKTEVEVVGPILWHLPEIGLRQGNNIDLKICVFDVTPVYRHKLLSLGPANYYNFENARQFIDDILSVVNNISVRAGKNINIVLKHKKAHLKIHDKRYLDYIGKLNSKNSNMSIAETDSNIFSLISSCDMVIVIPYSSPAYIADFLNIPAVFYDPTGNIIPDYPDGSKIIFASGKESLEKAASNIMGGMHE